MTKTIHEAQNIFATTVGLNHFRFFHGSFPSSSFDSGRSIILSTITVKYRYECNWRTTRLTNQLKVIITMS